MTFQPSLMFVGKEEEPTLEWSTWKALHLGRLRSYPQTLDKTGKACQGQNALAYYEKS